MLYNLCVAICLSYVALVIGFNADVTLGNSFQSVSEEAATLVYDLTTIRVWIVMAGLLIWSLRSAQQKSLTTLYGIMCALAWVMFIEDYMVLDRVLFMPKDPLAYGVVTSRPLFLGALTYLAFKQEDREYA